MWSTESTKQSKGTGNMVTENDFVVFLEKKHNDQKLCQKWPKARRCRRLRETFYKRQKNAKKKVQTDAQSLIPEPFIPFIPLEAATKKSATNVAHRYWVMGYDAIRVLGSFWQYDENTGQQPIAWKINRTFWKKWGKLSSFVPIMSLLKNLVAQYFVQTDALKSYPTVYFYRVARLFC